MSITDLMFPKLCIGCGHLGGYICSGCTKSLVPIKITTCLYCHRASYLGLTHHSCLKKLYIDGVLSIYFYNHFFKKLLKNIKYRLATEILHELFLVIKPENLYMLIKLKKIVNKALIQPIPLSNKRLKNRGFNQSLLIAEYLKRYLGLPIVDVLIRKTDNPLQAQIKSKSDRFKNTRGIFTLRPSTNIKNKTILLIDDVITSGSTVKEATRVLKKSLADKIYVITLAKG